MSEATNKLIQAAEHNVLTWQEIAMECIDYMGEDEVRDMMTMLPFDLLDDEDEEE